MHVKLRKTHFKGCRFIALMLVLTFLSFNALSANSNTNEIALEIEDATKRDSTSAYFREVNENGVAYYQVDTTVTEVNNDGQIIDFDVNFSEPGSYDLYLRFKVGPNGVEDDSFFAAPAFGKTNVGDSWVVVNQLSGKGYDTASFVVEGAGAAADSVWKWINVTAKEGALSSFEVDAAGRQVWSIGTREDGLIIDKIVFAPSGKKVEELDAIAVSEQQDLSGFEEEMPEISSVAFEMEHAMRRDSASSFFSEVTEDGVTYLLVDTTRTTVDTTAQIVDFTIDFEDAGLYDLYLKFRIGPDGVADDSFFASASLGANTVDGSWVTVNQLSGKGYNDDEVVVGGGGTVADSLWRWINVTANQGSLNSFEVESPGEMVWSFASRENGLAIDKVVFAASGKTVQELDSVGIMPEEDVLTSVALDIEDATRRDSLGNFFSEVTEEELTYLHVDTVRTVVDTIAQIIDFDVNFIDTGSYHLYIKFRVGDDGVADDSFFAYSNFGKGVVGGSWVTVNQLSGVGYSSNEMIVEGAGSSPDSVWRWIDVNLKGAIDDFIIEESGRKVWSFASRENGLMIDKIAFASPGLTVEDLNAIEVSAQEDLSEVEEDGLQPAQAMIKLEFEEAMKRDASSTVFGEATQGGVSYLTVNENNGSVDSDAQILDFEVDFQEEGIYHLYVRFNVGFEGIEDDSYFVSSEFGKKNVFDSWVTVNQLSGQGYVTGEVGGSVGSNTQDGIWKWVNITLRQNMTPFLVEEPGEVIWSFASRESGMSLDQIVFAAAGKTAEELDALSKEVSVPNDSILNVQEIATPDVWVHDNVLIIRDSHEYAGSKIYLFNLQGRNVWAKEIKDGNSVFDLSGLPSGVYVIQAKGKARKILIE